MGDGRSPSILVCRFTKSFCTISWPWRQMHVELVVVVLGVGVPKWRRRRRRRKMRKEFTPRASCRAVLAMPSFTAPRRPDVSHLFLLPASQSSATLIQTLLFRLSSPKVSRILNPESSRSYVEPHLERGTSPEIRRPHAKIHPPTFSISHLHARQAASDSYRDSSQRQRQR